MVQHQPFDTFTPLNQGGSSAGLEPLPYLEPFLCVSTAKEPAPRQENWMQNGTYTLLVCNKEPLIREWGSFCGQEQTKTTYNGRIKHKQPELVCSESEQINTCSESHSFIVVPINAGKLET